MVSDIHNGQLRPLLSDALEADVANGPTTRVVTCSLIGVSIVLANCARPPKPGEVITADAAGRAVACGYGFSSEGKTSLNAEVDKQKLSGKAGVSLIESLQFNLLASLPEADRKDAYSTYVNCLNGVKEQLVGGDSSRIQSTRKPIRATTDPMFGTQFTFAGSLEIPKSRDGILITSDSVPIRFVGGGRDSVWIEYLDAGLVEGAADGWRFLERSNKVYLNRYLKAGSSYTITKPALTIKLGALPTLTNRWIVFTAGIADDSTGTHRGTVHAQTPPDYLP